MNKNHANPVQTLITYLKIKILVQNQGGAKFQPAGILKYVEDLKRGSNAEVGPKDYFEIAYSYKTSHFYGPIKAGSFGSRYLL